MHDYHVVVVMSKRLVVSNFARKTAHVTRLGLVVEPALLCSPYQKKAGCCCIDGESFSFLRISIPLLLLCTHGGTTAVVRRYDALLYYFEEYDT